MYQPILEIKNDCESRGRGRKAWWARKLGVPPLTLSHWLAGRQRPNGRNAMAIREILTQIERGPARDRWEDYLWDSYYSKQEVPEKILPLVVLEMLEKPLLGVRTAALLIRLLMQRRLAFEAPSSGALRNRLGWLLEAAGRKATFHPNRSTKNQPVFLSPSREGSLNAYFRRNQTSIGRKWRIYDCALDETLKSIP